MGAHEIRVVGTADERAVVVHLRLGRCTLPVQVIAFAPLWVPFLRLPDCVMLDLGSYVELDAAIRTAFDVYRAQFVRSGGDNEQAKPGDHQAQTRHRRRVRVP
jgi:hypothetical protein